MSNRRLSIITAAALVLSIIQAAALSAQDVTVLRWKPVYGAGGYILEIRNNNKKIIVEKELTVTEYNISGITPGNYQYRLTTLNKLKRKGNSTSWINLMVEKAVHPVISSVSRMLQSHSFENPSFIVNGENFLRDTKLYLKKENDEIELKTSFISGSQLNAVFKSEKKITGMYDLVAINRGGFKSLLPMAIEIIDPDIPVLDGVSQTKIYNSIETKLFLKGENLGGDILVIVENEKGEKITVVQKIISDREISLTVNPSSLNRGVYNIKAVKRNYFHSSGKVQLDVSDPDVPVIESLSVDKIFQTVETKLIVKGRNLSGSVVFSVENSNGEKLKFDQNIISDTETVLSFLPDASVKGEYKISALKNNLFSSRNKLSIKVAEPDLIEIISVQPDSIRLYRGKLVLQVNGKNFNEDTHFQLRSRSLILEPYKISLSKGTASLYFDERKYSGGVYELYAENKPYKTVMKENALIINDASAGLLGLNSLYAGAGWSYNIPQGDWTSMLEPSMAGCNLYCSYPLSNVSFTGEIPFLKNCGVETIMNYSIYQFVNGTSSEKFTKTDLYAGMNYPVSLGFIDYSMSLIINIDFGVAYSFMSILSDGARSEYSSFDNTAEAGISLRYEWFNYYFTDISCQYKRTFYESHPMDEAGIYLRAGVRL